MSRLREGGVKLGKVKGNAERRGTLYKRTEK